jgi:hypothetical protein
VNSKFSFTISKKINPLLALAYSTLDLSLVSKGMEKVFEK